MKNNIEENEKKIEESVPLFFKSGTKGRIESTNNFHFSHLNLIIFMKISKSFFKSLFGLAILLVTTFSAYAQVDAAFFHHDRNVSYFFQGNQYYRLSGTQVDAGYPQNLPGGWQRLPGSFVSGIDAAVYKQDDRKIYLFKGDECVRITGTKVDIGYPKKIKQVWSGLSSQFYSGIDAALFREGKTYLFKGNKYVRMTGMKMDSGYPATLPGGWKFPNGFHSDLDAAIAFKPNGKNYVFKDKKYIRLSDTRTDGGYPANLPGGWKGLKIGNSTPDEEQKVSYWNYGLGVKSHAVTSSDFNISGDSYTGGNLATSIFDSAASASGVIGLADPTGIASAIFDVALELAKGIIQIVQKVRLENITHISAFTSVKNSKIKIIDVIEGADRIVQKDMLIKLKPKGGSYEGSLMPLTEITNAKDSFAAECKGDVTTAGLGLNIYPKGGGSIDPTFIIEAELGGIKYNFQLKTFNRVGTGLKSTYTLSGNSISTIEVASNPTRTQPAKYTVEEKTATFGNYKVILKLRHANNDQRKDMVLVSFATK